MACARIRPTVPGRRAEPSVPQGPGAVARAAAVTEHSPRPPARGRGARATRPREGLSRASRLPAEHALLLTLALASGALGCGGTTAVDRPRSVDSPDASSAVDASVDAAEPADVELASDGSHWDRTVWHDAWDYPWDAGYQVIDEGRDCGIPATTIRVPLGWGVNCCNGEVCRGRCLLFDGWDRPACACSGLIGGCSARWMCCTDVCSNDPTCGSFP